MSIKAKKARRIQKTFRKIRRTLFFGIIVAVALGWGILHYTDIMLFLDRFMVANINSAEVDTYYNLLSEHKQPGKNLILDLGVHQSDSLDLALKRLKDIMGLNDTHIDLSYYDKGRPAYIENWNDDMTIYVSPAIKERREQINLLTHELCHIYVWRLDKKIFGALDEEKLVDTSSVFVGLGVLALNGYTNEITSNPDGSFMTKKKTFGYLKPEQFGYLLARYCYENGITPATVRPHLNETGRKYYDAGRVALRKQTKDIEVPELVLKAQVMIRSWLEILREKSVQIWTEAKPWWDAIWGRITELLNSSEPGAQQ